VVAWLGELDKQGRIAVRQQGTQPAYQSHLFDNEEPEWIEVDLKQITVERTRRFGGPWLGLELLRKLGFDICISEAIPAGREDIPWAVMSLVLVLGRLCNPSSELYYSGTDHGKLLMIKRMTPFSHPKTGLRAIFHAPFLRLRIYCMMIKTAE